MDRLQRGDGLTEDFLGACQYRLGQRFQVQGVDAEELRLHLLEAYGTGLIATSPSDIRIAFSCLEVEQVEPLFDTLHEAIQKLRSR